MHHARKYGWAIVQPRPGADNVGIDFSIRSRSMPRPRLRGATEWSSGWQRPMLITKTLPARLGVVAGLALLYVLSAVPLLNWLGPAAVALAALPVAAAAALCGPNAGIIVATFCISLNTVLLNLAGYP